MKKASSKRGIGLLEIVIVSSIMVLVIIAIISTTVLYFNISEKTTNDIKVGYLLEEGVEAVKSMRDESWDDLITPLTASSTYYLVFSNTKWQSTTTPSTIDNIFLRSFSVYNVYRDSNDDISITGTLDPDTKKLTVSLSWYDPSLKATSTSNLSTYITNLFSN